MRCIKNKPSEDLLQRTLPLELWKMAEGQAWRSELIKFGVGAVVFDPKTQKPLGRGCAHYGFADCTTVHAETHALGSLPRALTEGAAVVIVSASQATGNWSYSARPCASCSLRLFARGVSVAYYAGRDSDGIWAVRAELISDLADIARRYDLKHRSTDLARSMRVRGVSSKVIAAA